MGKKSMLLALIVFLGFISSIRGQLGSLQKPSPAPRTLCLSQFALVNDACTMLPIYSVPPPSPPSPDPDDADNGEHRHRRHRSHHHKHREHQTPAEDNCCHWLREIDTSCVCDLLVHLPTFLSKPIHEYTVTVDDLCSVTFACGSRFRF